MRRVKGFDKARQLLSRENFWEPFAASQGLAPQTKQVFLSVQKAVDRIVGDVRDEGDKALFDYTEKLDGVRLDSLEVDRREIVAAYRIIDKEIVSALEFAAGRIRDFHIACEQKTGLIPVDRYLGRQVLPLQRVGLYVPGGSAAYPSTVLMMAIPARVAGVEEIIMVSPPGKDDKIPAPTLVAAGIAGVDRIFKLGGAQAIAALAFGTESVPRVDKICGPGNIFVTLAKRMVYGTVDIDGLEGPSEIAIIADEKASPALCAADLLAQAEHDPLASVILITTSAGLAKRVDEEIVIQLGKLKRRSVIKKALDAAMLVVVGDTDQAAELVNLFAPEHLSIMASDASALVRKIRNAGCIFVGENSPVVLGDYVAGPSHVLPTGGSARFGSPLGVADFLKVTNIIALDRPAMRRLSKAAMVIAEAEGLDAHAQAVARRLIASKSKQSHKISSPVKGRGKGKNSR
jgi:histidinol dehydrogenase